MKANNPNPPNKITFKDFCEQTSLHGWNFLLFRNFKSRHVMFWTFIIISAFTWCVVMIYLNAKEFSEATVDFQTETLTKPLNDVHFPSIFISNKNMFRKSIINEILQDEAVSNFTSTAELLSLWSRGFIFGTVTNSEFTQSELVADYVFAQSNKWPNVFYNFVNTSLKYHGDKVFPSTLHFFQDHTLKSFLDPDHIEAYSQQIMAHSTLDDTVLMISFKGKGIYHFGGHLADYYLPTNTFVPLFEDQGFQMNDLHSLKPGTKSGLKNGITFLLDTEIYDFTFSESQDEGFLLGIKHHLDFESFQLNSIDISPGAYLKIGVSSEVISTDESIRKRFDPDQTKCYFDGEIELDHLPSPTYRYSMTNCLYEAYNQKILDQCNCSVFTAPFNPQEFDSCIQTANQCLVQNNLFYGRFQEIISRGEKKTCYARCNDQTFTAKQSVSKYPNLLTFPQNGFDFCATLVKIRQSCKNPVKKRTLIEMYPAICDALENVQLDLTSLGCEKWNFEALKVNLSHEVIDGVKEYAKDNLAKVTVFMKDPYVKQIKRDVKISITSFFSNVGGLLGLFQGISLISIIEIAYLLSLWIHYKFRCVANNRSRIEDCVPDSK